MPKMKVIGQTVQAGECLQTDGQRLPSELSPCYTVNKYMNVFTKMNQVASNINQNVCQSFSRYIIYISTTIYFSVSIVKGAYPDVLLREWDDFHERKVSENDRPGG